MNTMKKKFWTRRRVIVTLLVLFGVYWFCFRGVSLRISPETTKITEPRTADGRQVDYFAALVSLSDPKVPPEENGFRMIAEALGRIPFENVNLGYWTEMCQILDLDPLAPPTTAYYKKMRNLYEAANAELGITTPLDDPERIAAQPEGTPEDWPSLWKVEPEVQPWLQAKFEQTQENPWTGEDDLFMPFMEQYIWEITPVLDLLGKAVRKEVYYIPLLPEIKNKNEAGAILDILLPCIQSQREFARDLSRRIMYYLGKGELDKAIEDTITIFRLGQHLQKENLVVVRAVGNVIQWNIGFPAAVHIFRDPNLTREQIERIATELDSLPKKGSISDLVLAGEYTMYSTISALSRREYAFNVFSGEVIYGEPKMKPILDWLNYYGYDWNTVSRVAGKFYDQQTAAMNEPDPFRRKKMKEKLLAETIQIDQRRVQLASYWRMIFVPTRSRMMGDSIGSYYAFFLQNNLDNLLSQGEAAVLLLRVAGALELYHKEEGRYPDRLEKLQGKYEVPGDPCSETHELFRYRLEERGADESGQVRYGYLMYSVGRSGTDLGGKTNLKIPGTEDLYVPTSDAGSNLPLRK